MASHPGTMGQKNGYNEHGTGRFCMDGHFSHPKTGPDSSVVMDVDKEPTLVS